MAVRVNDILKMHSLEGFRQVAGKAGNDRVVTTVMIADLAFPETDDTYTSVREGSFIITGILLGILDDSALLQAVKKASEVGASGVAIASRKGRVMPDEVLTYADQIMMPMFIFNPGEMSIEEILLDFMATLKEAGGSFSFTREVDRLLKGGLNSVDTAEISEMICPGARKNCVVVFIGPKTSKDTFKTSRAAKSFDTQSGENAACHLVPYMTGLFAIISMGRMDVKVRDRIVAEIMQLLDARADLITSYSGVHSTMEELDRAFRESYYAYQAARVEGLGSVEYKDIGIYKVLVPLKDEPHMVEFMQSYIQVMSAEWLETAKIFVQCKGSYDDAAKLMQCHRNTVRYRITRVRELVDEGKTEFEFNQNLAMAVKLHMLSE